MKLGSLTNQTINLVVNSNKFQSFNTLIILPLH